MNRSRHFSCQFAAAISVLFANLDAAQAGQALTAASQSNPATVTNGSASEDSSRPATTTFFGDTGLWFVPTAEVLGRGKWSVSAYRRGTDYIQGYTNLSDFAGTFAVGVGDRAEIFGSFLFDTRIDRDSSPVFFPDSHQGSFIDRNPLVKSVVDRRQRRRPVCRRQDQSLVGV